MKDTDEKVVDDLVTVIRRCFCEDFNLKMVVSYSVLDAYTIGFARGMAETIKTINKGENNGK